LRGTALLRGTPMNGSLIQVLGFFFLAEPTAPSQIRSCL
jgi:hypothetical protein